MNKWMQLLENFHVTKITQKTVKSFASKLLSQAEFYKGTGATPIIRLAGRYGFMTQPDQLDSDDPVVLIGDKAYERYKQDRVILVNRTADKYAQRWAVAIALADFILNYQQEEQQSLGMIRALAVELLLPTELYLKHKAIAQYEFSDEDRQEACLSKYFEVPSEAIAIKESLLSV